MTQEFTHNEIIELLPLFVLGSLDADKMTMVDAVVQQDPALQLRLLELESTVANLAHTAPPTPPPADSLSRLMSKIDAAADEAKPAEKPIIVHALDSSGRPQDTLAAFKRWIWATMVLSVACLLLAGFALQLWRENGRLNTQVALLQQQNIEQEALVTDLFGADRVMFLPGTDEAPQANGVFYTQDTVGFFVVNGLEPLPASQTYQLWLVPPDGTPSDAVSVGFLPVETGSQTASQTVFIPNDLLDFYIVDISVEPSGGSQNLSGPIVLRGSTE